MFVCISCGHLERERSAACPECGTVMRSERELAHSWAGRPGPNENYVLRCRERHQVAYMDYDIARELPYCPFCRRNLEYRPADSPPSPGMPEGPPSFPGVPRKD
ncbi:MAG: hypothetical protein FJ149_00820 [Euryarchaeota archaeon]|nr:hypothetical protein [Euryarchaeota archaeon]